MTTQLSPEAMRDLALAALDEVKAVDVVTLDVRGFTSITDFMLIASGTSDRHVKALAENVVKHSKDAGVQPLGVEGESGAEWVLIDLGDVLVHVMRPQVRDFYNLEKLWDTAPAESAET